MKVFVRQTGGPGRRRNASVRIPSSRTRRASNGRIHRHLQRPGERADEHNTQTASRSSPAGTCCATMLAFFGDGHRSQSDDGHARRHELDRPRRREHLCRQPAIQPNGPGRARAGARSRWTGKLTILRGEIALQSRRCQPASRYLAWLSRCCSVILPMRPRTGCHSRRWREARNLPAQHALRDGVWIVEVDS